MTPDFIGGLILGWVSAFVFWFIRAIWIKTPKLDYEDDE